MKPADPFNHYYSLINESLNEAVSSEESQQREIKSIVDKCRTITANYIKLLNNRRVSETKLLEYVQTKINPMIEYMETYLENSTPQEKEKFKMFIKELMTSSWLEVDASYWEEEMSKMVGGAVIYGEVGLENLEDLANQGNRDIDKLREGGSKIKEPHAGITDDMSGRWTIKAFDTSKRNKKETPPMR